jgi:hypothetical protein
MTSREQPASLFAAAEGRNALLTRLGPAERSGPSLKEAQTARGYAGEPDVGWQSPTPIIRITRDLLACLNLVA